MRGWKIKNMNKENNNLSINDLFEIRIDKISWHSNVHDTNSHAVVKIKVLKREELPT